MLDFIAQYGCGKAPDEAFDTLAKHIFAFQFERNLPIPRLLHVQTRDAADARQLDADSPMPVDGFKMLTLTSVPEQGLRSGVHHQRYHASRSTRAQLPPRPAGGTSR